MEPLIWHDFIRAVLKGHVGKILNVGCANDPARLSSVVSDITNVDIREECPTFGKFLEAKNFQLMDARELELPNNSFDVVVVGELLDHCDIESGVRIIQEAARVAKPNGSVIVTLAQDPRTPEKQLPENERFPWGGGATSWRQTYWHDDAIDKLFQTSGLQIDETHLLVDVPEVCKKAYILLKKANHVSDIQLPVVEDQST